MKKFRIIILIIFSFVPLFSIDLNIDNSAYSNTYGSICFINQHPSNSFFNPSFCKSGIETSITTLFSMSELVFYNLSYGKNFKSFGISTGLSYLDNPNYKEGKFFLSFSKKFYDIHFGVSVRNIFTKIINENLLLGYAFDFGFYKNFKSYGIAFSWKNITNAKFDSENLPVYMIWEINYKILNNTKFSLGIEKQTGFDYQFLFASNFKYNNYLNFFSGYRFSPQRIGLGFEISIKKVILAYSILTHPELPITHYISLQYAL